MSIMMSRSVYVLIIVSQFNTWLLMNERVINMESKTLKRIIVVCCTMFIILSMCMNASAANVMFDGYYQQNIYVQNLASGSYGTAVTQAVYNWNNAGISPRSIVINSVSSCRIYDDDFSNEAIADYSSSYGLYLPLSSVNVSCTCHTTSIFSIFLNTQTLPSNYIVSTAAHELGHAFGLNDDSSSELRLMSYSRNRATVVAPIADEVSSMLTLWNNNH